MSHTRSTQGRKDKIAIDYHVFRYRESNALALHRTSRTNRLCKLEINLRTIRNHGDTLVTGARATAGVMIVAEVGADDGGVTVADGGTGVGEEAGPPL
jgi:hypothetical protein